jgi:hypothetical protein
VLSVAEEEISNRASSPYSFEERFERTVRSQQQQHNKRV